MINKNYEYDTEVIGGVKIEPFDTLKMHTRYDKEAYSHVVQKKLEYNGAVDSSVTFINNNKSRQS